MAFALAQLYEQRTDDRRLTHAAYEAFGGVQGAISRRAEDSYLGLDAAAQATLPAVFRELVEVDPTEAGWVATRRRAKLDQAAPTAEAQRLVTAFTKARLLQQGAGAGEGQAPVAEVAHEALLRTWPRLTDWIQKAGEALRMRHKVADETRAWVREGRLDVRRWRHELLEDARRLLGEAGLLEAMERETDVGDFLVPEAEWLLAELLCSGTDHGRRETVGMRLSEIGDPRPGVGLIAGVPEILWCDIPAGEVELEDHGRFEVAPFRMAAYPVTYAQHRAFLDADDGYRSDDWWADPTRDAPGSQRRPYASYPADNLSWFDATAFCRWLSARLGCEVRLPDEWEWQWAAQSAQPDFTYPWGPEWREGLANTYESGIGRTTAAGMYPGGRSRQGVYDLAGNVREWCRNANTDPRRVQASRGESRVVRGGSWLNDPGFARAVLRNHSHPSLRYDYFGFRVVCSSPIR